MSEETVKRGRGRPRKNETEYRAAEPEESVRTAKVIRRISQGVVMSSSSVSVAGNGEQAVSVPDGDVPEVEIPETNSPGPEETVVKRRPGRPRKNPLPDDAEESTAGAENAENSGETPVKRRPGRPRKNPLPEEADNAVSYQADAAEGSAVKRKPGRPRTAPQPIVVATATILRENGSGAENSGYERKVSSMNYVGEDRYSVEPAAPLTESYVAPSPNTAPAREYNANAGFVPNFLAENVPGAFSVRPSEISQDAVRAEKTQTAQERPVVITNSGNHNMGFGGALSKFKVSDSDAPMNFKAPGVRLGKVVDIGGARLSFFYIVFKSANYGELLYPDTMHSIQHLLSAAAKEAKIDNIIKVMPCGSRTAVEIAVVNASSDFVAVDLRRLMVAAGYMDKIPSKELARCSYPEYQNFEDAHREVCDFVEAIFNVTITGFGNEPEIDAD